MFTTHISSMVEVLKDLIPYKVKADYITTIKNALYLRIPLELEYNNKKKFTFAHFIIAEYSYFAAESKELYIDMKDYKLISTHDSCWRFAISTFLSKIYFRMAREINKNIPPFKMNSLTYLSLFKMEKITIFYNREEDTFKLTEIKDGWME